MKWFDSDHDYIGEFSKSWNERIHKIKKIMIIIAICMIILGLLCGFFPKGAFSILKYAASAILIIWGIGLIYQYCVTNLFFRDILSLLSGIMNIMLGISIASMPVELTASTFALFFGMMLLVNGFQKLSIRSKLRFFQIGDVNYFGVTGWIQIFVAICFMAMPFQSAIVLNYILAAYLIIDGVCMLIEGISMKGV